MGDSDACVSYAQSVFIVLLRRIGLFRVASVQIIVDSSGALIEAGGCTLGNRRRFLGLSGCFLGSGFGSGLFSSFFSCLLLSGLLSLRFFVGCFLRLTFTEAGFCLCVVTLLYLLFYSREGGFQTAEKGAGHIYRLAVLTGSLGCGNSGWFFSKGRRNQTSGNGQCTKSSTNGYMSHKIPLFNGSDELIHAISLYHKPDSIKVKQV